MSSRDLFRCNLRSMSIELVAVIPTWVVGGGVMSNSGLASLALSSCFTSSKVALSGKLRASAS